MQFKDEKPLGTIAHRVFIEARAGRPVEITLRPMIPSGETWTKREFGGGVAPRVRYQAPQTQRNGSGLNVLPAYPWTDPSAVAGFSAQLGLG